jgi:hypothetical protein
MAVRCGSTSAVLAKALPLQWLMRGLRKYSTWGMCLLVIAFGLYMVPRTLGLI